jgi:hypothetical protein
MRCRLKYTPFNTTRVHAPFNKTDVSPSSTDKIAMLSSCYHLVTWKCTSCHCGDSLASKTSRTFTPRSTKRDPIHPKRRVWTVGQTCQSEFSKYFSAACSPNAVITRFKFVRPSKLFVWELQILISSFVEHEIGSGNGVFGKPLVYYRRSTYSCHFSTEGSKSATLWFYHNGSKALRKKRDS